MVLQFVPLMGLLFFLLFTWQAIKGDYREFLSGEQRGQVITVSQSEALAKFQRARKWRTRIVRRGNVLTFFKAPFAGLDTWSISLRPSGKFQPTLPYENGQLLMDNLTFALVPRILNPNKGVKDDKVKVEKYHRLQLRDQFHFFLQFGALLRGLHRLGDPSG